MPPQTTQPAPATPTQAPSGGLDPQVVALAQAVRQQESGGDASATGASGEYGAYQYEPGTWAKQAAAAGVDVPLKQATMAQQNQVWYTWAKGMKDQGYTPGQIASMQNAGQGEPNAYTGKFSTGLPSTGTNADGVKYNVPQYVNDVMKYYQQYKGQGLQQAPTGNLASATVTPPAGGYTPPTPPGQTTPAQSGNAAGYAPPTPPPAQTAPAQAPATGSDPSGGFLQGLQEDLTGTNPDSIGTQLENTGKGVGNFLLPSIGDTYNDLTGNNKKTALQQFGDAGSTLLGIASVIPGLDLVSDPLEAARGALGAADVAEGASKAAPGLLSAVGKNAALGGAFGATGAVGAGKTNLGDIAKSTAEGAAAGGVLGGIGHGVSGLLENAAGKTGEANLREFTTVRKTLNKALIDNSRGAGTEAATDPISTLAQTGLIKDLKVTQGKIDADALTNGNGTGKLDSLVEGHSQDASNLVKSMADRPGIPLDQFKASAEADIKNDPTIRGTLSIPKALAALDSKIDSAKISYGDVLPWNAIDEIRAGMNKVYDPNERDTARVLGDTARNFLYHGDETNAALKSAMANESELIRARNYVQRLHGTAMGKGMQKIAHEIIGSGIGGAIGSIGGPIPAGIGAAATGAATKMAEDAISGNKFDPLGAKVAGGLLKAAKGKAPQVAGRVAKVGLMKAASGI